MFPVLMNTQLPQLPLPMNRKKRLLDTVQEILNSTDIDVNKRRQLIEAQDMTFDDYENQLNYFKTKAMQTEQNLQSAQRHIQRLYTQMNQKSIIINKKNKELSLNMGIILTLRSEIDSYQMRVIEAESQNEENVRHYKKIITEMTKDKNSELKSADYMSHIRQVIKAYDNDEPVESLNKSENTCVICLQKTAKVICYPCCHLEFCCECAGLYVGKDEVFFRDHNELHFTLDEKFQCTRCKSDIDKLHYIFT